MLNVLDDCSIYDDGRYNWQFFKVYVSSHAHRRQFNWIVVEIKCVSFSL